MAISYDAWEAELKKTRKKVCLLCFKPFFVNPKDSRTKHCNSCQMVILSEKRYKPPPPPPPPEMLVCQYCGEEYEKPLPPFYSLNSAHYCSTQCRKKATQLILPVRNCEICGKQYQPKSKVSKTCSYDCSQTRMKLRVPPKIRICKSCGKEFEVWGSAVTCSIDCKSKYDMESNPSWLAIRYRVLKRDGFRCRYCNRSVADLGNDVILNVLEAHVDHIHPRSMGGQDIEANLITSCSLCNLGKSDVCLLAREGEQLPTFMSIYSNKGVK